MQTTTLKPNPPKNCSGYASEGGQ